MLVGANQFQQKLVFALLVYFLFACQPLRRVVSSRQSQEEEKEKLIMKKLFLLLVLVVFLITTTPTLAFEFDRFGDAGDETQYEELPAIYGVPGGDFPILKEIPGALELETDGEHYFVRDYEGVALYDNDWNQLWRVNIDYQVGGGDPISIRNGLVAAEGGVALLRSADAMFVLSLVDGSQLYTINEGMYLPLGYDLMTNTILATPIIGGLDGFLHTHLEGLVFIPLVDGGGVVEKKFEEPAISSAPFYIEFITGEKHSYLLIALNRSCRLIEVDFMTLSFAELNDDDFHIRDGDILYTIYDNTIYRYDPSSEEGLSHLTTVEDAELFRLVEDELFVGGSSVLTCLDAATLEEKWSTSTYRRNGWAGDKFRSFTRLYVTDELVFLVGDRKGLAVFNRADGSDLWVNSYKGEWFPAAEEFVAIHSLVSGELEALTFLVDITFDPLAALFFGGASILFSLDSFQFGMHYNPDDGFLGISNGYAFFWRCRTSQQEHPLGKQTGVDGSELLRVDITTGEGKVLEYTLGEIKPCELQRGDPIVYNLIEDTLIASTEVAMYAFGTETLEPLWSLSRGGGKFSMRQQYVEELYPEFYLSVTGYHQQTVRDPEEYCSYEIPIDEYTLLNPKSGAIGSMLLPVNASIFFDGGTQYLTCFGGNLVPAWPLTVYYLSVLSGDTIEIEAAPVEPDTITAEKPIVEEKLESEGS